MVLCNLMNKNRSSFRLSVRVICSTSSKYQSESEYPKTELSQKAQKNSLDADILDVLCKTKYEKKLTKYSRKSDMSLWERIMELSTRFKNQASPRAGWAGLFPQPCSLSSFAG